MMCPLYLKAEFFLDKQGDVLLLACPYLLSRAVVAELVDAQR